MEAMDLKVLRAVAESGRVGMSSTLVARKVGRNPGSTLKSIKWLRRHGYIEVFMEPLRGGAWHRITAKGKMELRKPVPPAPGEGEGEGKGKREAK